MVGHFAAIANQRDRSGGAHGITVAATESRTKSRQLEQPISAPANGWTTTGVRRKDAGRGNCFESREGAIGFGATIARHA